MGFWACVNMMKAAGDKCPQELRHPSSRLFKNVIDLNFVIVSLAAV